MNHPAATQEVSHAAASRLRRMPMLVAALVLVIPALLVWDGSRKVPAEARMGDELRGASVAAVERPALRIASFNIWGGRRADGEVDLDLQASVLDGFDLIGLQEVKAETPFRRFNNAVQLGERLEMGFAFAPTERQWWSDHFGNALLSGVPVRHWQSIPLQGTQKRGHRNVMLVRVPHDGQIINVLNTHIDRRVDREPQLAAVIEMFRALAKPAVLMGDLNSDQRDPLIRRLLDDPTVDDAVGLILGEADPMRVDWIFTRGLRIVDGGVVEEGASDHPMVWAEVELP